MKTLIPMILGLAIIPAHAAELKPAAAAGPAAAPAASAPAPAAAATSSSTATVARSQFTTAVQDREPTDKVTNLINDKTQVYFFSEIKDGANQKVTHRWEHDGKVVSEIGFDVGGNRWRVFSSKTLDPASTGEWKVSVVDGNGHTLSSNTLTYDKAPAATAAPAAAAPTQSK